MFDMSKLNDASFKEYKNQAANIQKSTAKKLCTDISKQLVPPMNIMIETMNLIDDDPSVDVKKIDVETTAKLCTTGVSKFDKAMGALEISCDKKGLHVPKRELIAAMDACEMSPAKGKNDDLDLTVIAAVPACATAALARITGDKRVADCVVDNKTLVEVLTELSPVLAIGAGKMSNIMDKL